MLKSKLDPKEIAELMVQAQHIFFDAMADGYANDRRPMHDHDLPGSRIIEYDDGDFELRDQWFVTDHSDRSDGMTIICWKRQPIWIMHYGGWYEKSVLPFLKQCLFTAYATERKFYGGRGPININQGRLAYVNSIKCNGFQHFFGEETIVTNRPRGLHWYRGESLLSSG